MPAPLFSDHKPTVRRAGGSRRAVLAELFSAAGGRSELRSLFGMTATAAPPQFIPMPRSRPARAFDGVKSALVAYRLPLIAVLVPAGVISALLLVRSNAEFVPQPQRAAAVAAQPPAPAANSTSEITQDHERLARALQEAAAAKLASEREAQLAAEVEAQAQAREVLARETAEKAAAAEQARIEAEGAARRTAEEAAEEDAAKLARDAEALDLQHKFSERAAAAEQERHESERRVREAAAETAAAANEKLAHRSLANAHVSVPVAPAPETAAAAPANEANAVATVVAANAAEGAAAPPPAETANKTRTAEAELRDGEALFERGHVEDARRHFERAAGLGLPEAALALGNTFDPVSLAKAGLAHPGDRERARRWYRRAFTLALSHKEDAKKRNAGP